MLAIEFAFEAFVGHPVIVHVGRAAGPADDFTCVAHRNPAQSVPAIPLVSVHGLDAKLDLVRLAAGKGALEDADDACEILGRKHLLPAESGERFGPAQARVVVPAAVRPIDRAVCVVRVDDVRDVIGDGPEAGRLLGSNLRLRQLALDRHEELLRRERFGDVAVGTGAQGGGRVRVVRLARGQYEDRRETGGLERAQTLDRFDAGNPRHHHVAEDEVWARPSGRFEPACAVRRADDVVQRFENALDVGAQVGVVVDAQHARACRSAFAHGRDVRLAGPTLVQLSASSR